MVTSVLAGLAGTECADAVVETAVNLATTHHAPITAITAVNIQALRNVGPVPPGGGQAAKELRDYRVKLTQESIEEAISRFEARCKEAGVTYQVMREQRESPYDFLASQSRYHDITVLSLRSIFEYDIRMPHEADASVTLAKLISAGVRPILAVPPEYRDVKRVFVAYSGSMESAATLRRFMQLRPYDNVQVCIATFDMDEQRARRLLSHAAEYCGRHAVDAQTVYVPEIARDHLLAEAMQRESDLIVLGNSAKNLTLRRVFGETALRTIREAEVPLFLSQ